MDSDRITRSRKWFVWTIVAVAAIVLGTIAGHRHLAAAVERVIEACRAAGPWAYFGAMAVLPIFGFSLFAFVASAGPVFAPTMGIGSVIACGLAALTVNVSLSYLLARRGLRPLAERAIRHFGCVVPDVCRYGPWDVSLLMRLLPGPPFGLQSCLLGLAGIPFGVYLITSVAVPALYFAGMVCISSGAAAHSPWLVAGAGAALAVISCAVRRLRGRLVSVTAARPAAG